MPRHHVTVSPCRGFIIIAICGQRDEDAAAAALDDVLALRAETGLTRLMFDTRQTRIDLKPERLMARALTAGRSVSPSRIAIMAEHGDDTHARIWRKGLEETGHEALVFTDAAEAQAWLLTQADAPQVFVS